MARTEKGEARKEGGQGLPGGSGIDLFVFSLILGAVLYGLLFLQSLAFPVKVMALGLALFHVLFSALAWRTGKGWPLVPIPSLIAASLILVLPEFVGFHRLFAFVLSLILGLFPILTAFAAYVTRAYSDVPLREKVFFFLLWALGVSRTIYKVTDGELRVERVGQISALTRWIMRLAPPGQLLVDVGYAAVLERGGKFTRVVGPGMVHTQGFERVAYVVDVRPQEVDLSETVRIEEEPYDLYLRAWVQVQGPVREEAGEAGAGEGEEALPANPYPFKPEAVYRLVYSLSSVLGEERLKKPGSVRWTQAVQQVLRQVVVDFFALPPDAYKKSWGIEWVRRYTAKKVEAEKVREKELRVILTGVLERALKRLLQTRLEEWGLRVLDLQIERLERQVTDPERLRRLLEVGVQAPRQAYGELSEEVLQTLAELRRMSQEEVPPGWEIDFEDALRVIAWVLNHAHRLEVLVPFLTSLLPRKTLGRSETAPFPPGPQELEAKGRPEPLPGREEAEEKKEEKT